jgi:hypothetical protein
MKAISLSANTLDHRNENIVQNIISQLQPVGILFVDPGRGTSNCPKMSGTAYQLALCNITEQ